MSEIHILLRREYDGSGYAILRAYENKDDAMGDLKMLVLAGITGDVSVESLDIEPPRPKKEEPK